MVKMIDALIFDCDGVLVDTERDGHRVAFNKAFADKKIDAFWSVEDYKELVKIAGGKERMEHFFNENGWPEKYPEHFDLIVELHHLKTKIFMELIGSGALPLRPGIKRIIDDAIENQIILAVCSTSNEKSVNLIIEKLLGEDRKAGFKGIFAGDVVSRKKPDPEIYNLCSSKLNLNPQNCVVIEDSRNGLLAAKAAGFNCLITTNDYTREEDFAEANLVVDELGDGKHIQITIADLRQLISNKNQ